MTWRATLRQKETLKRLICGCAADRNECGGSRFETAAARADDLRSRFRMITWQQSNNDIETLSYMSY